MTIKLSKTAITSARDYVDALLEACGKAGVADPVEVILDTDAYPKVTREIEMSEFIVGWFHGVAEALDVEVGDIWAQLAGNRTPAIAAKPERKAARKPASKRELAPARKPPRRTVHVTSEATAAAVKRETPGAITVVAVGATERHADALRDKLAPAPIPAMPPEGYGSPAVGALTGKRRRKAAPAAQGSLPMGDAATHAAATEQLAAMRARRGKAARS